MSRCRNSSLVPNEAVGVQAALVGDPAWVLALSSRPATWISWIFLCRRLLSFLATSTCYSVERLLVCFDSLLFSAGSRFEFASDARVADCRL